MYEILRFCQCTLHSMGLDGVVVTLHKHINIYEGAGGKMANEDTSGEYLYRVRGLPGQMTIVKIRKKINRHKL